MSEQDDNDSGLAEVSRLNADLTRGLERCSGIVRDYRSRLIAANSNEAYNGDVCNESAERENSREQTG